VQTLSSENPRLKVLIADDEPIIANTLALILKQCGFDTVCALSGEDAVRAASACRPDVLVLDVYMRGISGIETALRIRSLYPGCKTIIISGAAPTNELVAETASLGDDVDLLIKPFAPDKLLERIFAQTNRPLARVEIAEGGLVSGRS
jgi:DNA-binding response OmpR family regulator